MKRIILTDRRDASLREPEEMKFAAIDEGRIEYALKVMCKALRVSKSGYHA